MDLRLDFTGSLASRTERGSSHQTAVPRPARTVILVRDCCRHRGHWTNQHRFSVIRLGLHGALLHTAMREDGQFKARVVPDGKVLNGWERRVRMMSPHGGCDAHRRSATWGVVKVLEDVGDEVGLGDGGNDAQPAPGSVKRSMWVHGARVVHDDAAHQSLRGNTCYPSTCRFELRRGPPLRRRAPDGLLCITCRCSLTARARAPSLVSHHSARTGHR